MEPVIICEACGYEIKFDCQSCRAQIEQETAQMILDDVKKFIHLQEYKPDNYGEEQISLFGGLVFMKKSKCI